MRLIPFRRRKNAKGIILDTWRNIESQGVPYDRRPNFYGQHRETVRYKGKYYDIPTDDNGFVLPEDIIQRFYQVEGYDRDPRKDKSRDAKAMIPTAYGLTPKDIVAWWANPGKMDIHGIDDKEHKLISNAFPVRKGAEEAHERIYIPEDVPWDTEYRIRQSLESSFDVDEIKSMVRDGSINVKIVEPEPEDKRLKKPDTEYVKGRGDFSPLYNLVRFAEGQDNPEVITHEFTHVLKFHDQSRNGPITRSYFRDFDDARKRGDDLWKYRYRDLDESSTELETIARMTPYVEPGGGGYYNSVQPESRKGILRRRKAKRWDEMMKDDRELISGDLTYGLHGTELVDSLEEDYDKSHISRMRYDADILAMDTARMMGYKSEGVKKHAERNRKQGRVRIRRTQG